MNLKTINTIVYVFLFPANVVYTIIFGQILGRILLYSQKILRNHCQSLLIKFDKAVIDQNFGTAKEINKKITRNLNICTRLIDKCEYNMNIPKKVISRISYTIYKLLFKETK